jgi:hypothetical protein
LRAETNVAHHSAASLGHAMDVGFLDVVAGGDARLANDVARQNDSLAADAGQ